MFDINAYQIWLSYSISHNVKFFLIIDQHNMIRGLVSFQRMIMMWLLFVQLTHNVLEIKQLIVILGNGNDRVSNSFWGERVGGHMDIDRLR